MSCVTFQCPIYIKKKQQQEVMNYGLCKSCGLANIFLSVKILYIVVWNVLVKVLVLTTINQAKFPLRCLKVIFKTDDNLIFHFLYFLLPRELQYQNIIKSRCETHILKTCLHLYIKMIHIKFYIWTEWRCHRNFCFPL